MNTSMLLSVAALAVAGGSAQAQLNNGDFQNGLTGWTITGDAVAQAGTMILTTAYNDVIEAPFNRSGQPAADIAQVEAAAGVLPYAFDLAPPDYGVEGSLATQSFAVQAGQTLSFTWSFGTQETEFLDHAFVVVDGQVFTLASRGASSLPQSFSHPFTSSGNATLAFGVVDTGDVLGVSTLSVSNVQLTSAVPEPGSAALLLAGVGVLGLLASRRRTR